MYKLPTINKATQKKPHDHVTQKLHMKNNQQINDDKKTQ
jgi:hypothetical protein